MRLGGILLLTFISVGKIWADPILTFTPDSLVLSGPPSSLLTLTGTLTNASGVELFLNGAISNIGYSELTVDFTPFFVNAPLSLLDGSSYAGPLFTVAVSNIAVPGDYFGSFSIQGGIDDTLSNDLAGGDFQVTVTSESSVPEPSSFTLLAIGMLGAGCAAGLRRATER